MVANSLRKILRNEKAEAFIIFNNEESGQPATRYISGFSGSSSVLVVSPKKQAVITDGRYYEQAMLEAPRFELVKYEGRALGDILACFAKTERLRKILIDGNVTSAAELGLLQKRLRGTIIVQCNGLLQEIRVVKSPDEIQKIARAARIASRAFRKLVKTIKVGETERALAARLEFFMKEEGADAAAFDTIVASGTNGARPHALPTDKKIKKGELITFDFGARAVGYNSDITRTVAVGRVPDALRRIYEAVRASQRAGIKAARAGVTGRALDQTCREVLRAHGYEKYFLHATGHGLGMEVHELPTVSRTNTKKLPAGAVITIEPGVYIMGLGGVRIEDDLTLTRTSAKNLTSAITTELITIRAR